MHLCCKGYGQICRYIYADCFPSTWARKTMQKKKTLGLPCCICFGFGSRSIHLGRVSHAEKNKHCIRIALLHVFLELDCFPFTWAG